MIATTMTERERNRLIFPSWIAGTAEKSIPGFFLDTHAAIRVIYKGERGVHRQKPVYFYDRHGRPVPIPRQIEHPKVEPQERKPDQRRS
jgi:hypothetical protein